MKRQRQNDKLRQQNRSLRSIMRKSIREAREAIDKGELNEAVTASVASATRTIDKMSSKGLIHKNTAANYKSRLLKKYNTLSGNSAAGEPSQAEQADTSEAEPGSGADG